MRAVVLSPHLDDAVFSCGGMIAQRVRAGDECHVLTFFTGASPPGCSSSRIREHHDEMGNPPDVMGMRRREDDSAMELLGASASHLGHLDALYRLSDDEPIFTDSNRMNGELVSTLVEDIAAMQAEGCELYAPLAIGGHVDHLLVHMAAREVHKSGARMLFYEDFPYALDPIVLEAGLAALEPRECEPVELDEEAMAAKLEAMSRYASQARLIAGHANAANADEVLAHLCRGYAMFAGEGRGFAERYWRWGAGDRLAQP